MRRSSRTARATAIATVAVASCGTFATTADATEHPLGPGAIGSDARMSATASTAFAGYSAILSGQLTVKAKIAVPAVTCTSASTSPLFAFVGIFGAADNEFVESAAVVKITCTGTSPLYGAFIISHSSRAGLTVAVQPGDTVAVTGSVTADADSVTLTDIRTAQSTTQTGTGFGAAGVQFTVQGGANGAVAFPALTPVSFRGAKINGRALASFDPDRYKQVDSAGRPLIGAAALRDGTEFTCSDRRSA